ncbi:hypothetical protein QNH46_01425 [Paenibacillus woosongensis]|uniref:Nudix hydrolase domain-containing protein n=1 Tax=Paenibacillus woosongensis TaxID=307580 RepID=A0A7X2Z4N9_9BACL|nr:hypothetical protein [Paenibacillus woosongensis]MUG46973.1 hypothetical protein [Paenibacillus woosongensis]WHX49381.1 hypothetical protein QNH46_01425 [Paenibacillus woosongensis]
MEQVLVIPRYILNDVINDPSPKMYVNNIREVMDKVHSEYEFMLREKAEHDLNYKQIIPYGFITYGDFFFVMKRLKKQNETRLHNKISIGVGGHINPIELESKNIIEAGLFRELDEEVYLDKDHIESVEIIGIINDDTNEVGKVHLGFVYHIILNKKECDIAEKDKMLGEWIHKEDIKDCYNEMESWTQIIFDNIKG